MKQRTFRLISILAILLAIWQATPAQTAQLPQSSVVTSEVETALQENDTAQVIINLNAPDMSVMSMDDQMATVQSLQDSVLSGLSASEFTLKRRFQIIPALAGGLNSAGLQTLSQNSNVASIELDQVVKAHDSTALEALQADTVHSNYGVTGKGVTAAVLDTGIDLDNDDFEDRIIAQHCFTNEDCQEDEDDGTNEDETDYADD